MHYILIFILSLTLSGKLFAESTSKEPSLPILQDQTSGTPISLEGKELFRIYSNLGNLNPQERALIIHNRIKRIKESQSFDDDKLLVIRSDNTVDIVYDNSIIMAITNFDAEAAKLTSEELAEQYAQILKTTLKIKPKYTVANNPNEIWNFFSDRKDILIKISIAIFSFIFFTIVNIFLSKLFRKIDQTIENQKEKKIKPVLIKGNEIISSETLVFAFTLFFKGLRLSIGIGFIYLFFMEVFALFPWTQSSTVMEVLKGSLLILLTLAIGWGIYKIFTLGLGLLRTNISDWKGDFIQPLKIKTVTVLTEEQIVIILQKVVQGIQLLLNVFLLYIFLPILFSFFEFTSNWADTLFGYIFQPIKSLFLSILTYLPNLFFILVIIGFTRLTNNLIELFFDEIEKGHLSFPNFHQDWAEPTFKIVKTLVNIFALILIFPYLPGSQSEAFKGVSMFIGILFSLGSTSVIANIVSGIVLTYTNAFKIGDRIKLGEVIGTVVEKNLLVTRIETNKLEIVTLPNSIAMGNHIINYTTSAKTGQGLIVHSTVTLGYDVNWQKVHRILIDAACATNNILLEPKPFVLQTALGDFSVSYEINCYTNRPELIAQIKSELHQNIQDKCNEAGIEILSPNYISARDGNQSTIPSDYLGQTYQAPSFLVQIVEKLSGK